MDDLLVTALYKFVALPDYEGLRGPLLDECLRHGLRGTLLLAPEGINGTIAGSDQGIERVLQFLCRDKRLRNLEVKQSRSAKAPFARMKVRLKQEIVTMGVGGIDPTRCAGIRVEAHDWNGIVEDPGITLIDTRNDYEVAIGTFRGAIDPGIKTFREFPDWLRGALGNHDHPRVAMFCTGGIRCEKSSAFLRAEGVHEVYQLQGGILKYLEHVPEEESLWQGECFVFDERVALGHSLRPGTHELCRACRCPINAQDKRSADYIEGVSCPRCAQSSSSTQKAGFSERTRQIKLARARGATHMGRARSRGTGSECEE